MKQKEFKLGDMDINNNGTTRIVLLTDNYAIKIPRIIFSGFHGKVFSFLNGWIANRKEYEWSKSDIFDFLCKVEYSYLFSMVIVMKKMSPINNTQFNKQEKFNFGYEHKKDSYGLTKDNKIIVVDYG